MSRVFLSEILNKTYVTETSGRVKHDMAMCFCYACLVYSLYIIKYPCLQHPNSMDNL